MLGECGRHVEAIVSATELEEVSDVLTVLGQYAACRAAMMRYQDRGWHAGAAKLDTVCQQILSRLPMWAQWRDQGGK